MKKKRVAIKIRRTKPKASKLAKKHAKQVKRAPTPPQYSKTIIDVKSLMSLDEAKKYVFDLAGDKGIEIFTFLLNRSPIEENKLARKMKFERANAIRKFLYRLYSKNLVSYIKKKHGVKAWYTYYWEAHPDRLLFLIQKDYEDEIKQAQKSIDLNKATDFFTCNTCNRRYDLQTALENDFVCSNCHGQLSHMDINQVLVDKENRIAFLNEKIKKLSLLVKTRKVHSS
jgi:transcription factor E